MTCAAAAFLVFQDWFVDWFGETSAVQWVGLFVAFLFAAAVGLTVYHSLLRGHIASNRYPSGLRSFCSALAAALACGAFAVIFYGALMYYVSAVLFFICATVAAVFFFSSRKLATKL